nr:hypothetical protein [uncultured bacterium]
MEQHVHRPLIKSGLFNSRATSGTPTSGRADSKERADGAERPSALNQVWSIRLTAASIPQPVNESA